MTHDSPDLRQLSALNGAAHGGLPPLADDDWIEQPGPRPLLAAPDVAQLDQACTASAAAMSEIHMPWK